jgi:hypothetical protein
VRLRVRLAKLDPDDRFLWRKGSRPCLYGLDRLKLAREKGHVVLVEGESDSHTLWQHEIPVVGIPAPELTLSEFVELYLERHAASVRAWTISELRKRLRYAVTAFGDVPLRDLERTSGEVASWRTRLPSAPATASRKHSSRHSRPAAAGAT